jgi:hypothetical protein
MNIEMFESLDFNALSMSSVTADTFTVFLNNLSMKLTKQVLLLVLVHRGTSDGMLVHAWSKNRIIDIFLCALRTDVNVRDLTNSRPMAKNLS